MKCDRCDKPATVHLTRVVKGQVQKLHLCADCAQEMGLQSGKSFSLSDVLMGQPAGHSAGPGPKVCRSCGLTLQRFRKEGRLGCPECYSVFGKDLDRVLTSMHSATEHQGRRPARMCQVCEERDQLEALVARLTAAIDEEDYERAAQLRDEVRCLEGKQSLESGEGSCDL